MPASRPLVVLKFGGTSVSTPERWTTIAGIVRERLEAGERPVVVCSAASGVSRQLEALCRQAVAGEPDEALHQLRQRHLDLADALEVEADGALGDFFETMERLAHGMALTGEASPRLRAQVLALGELMLTRLGHRYLEAAALQTAWHDARLLLLATEIPRRFEHRHYLSATSSTEPDAALKTMLADEAADVVLTQGFIARDEAGDTVLLGWGGSDTSAAYLAAKLQAARLEIWTDVPGLFSANPQGTPEARHLRHLGYGEAQELAMAGAEVLHPRSIAPAQRQAMPIWVRSTLTPEQPGTRIDAEPPEEGHGRIKAVAPRDGLSLVTVTTPGLWQEVGKLGSVFSRLKEHNLSAGHVATGEASLTFALDPTGEALEPMTVRALLRDLREVGEVEVVAPAAAVTLVGRALPAAGAALGEAFALASRHGLLATTQAADGLGLTFFVPEEQAQPLAAALHAALLAHVPEDAVFGPAWGF